MAWIEYEQDEFYRLYLEEELDYVPGPSPGGAAGKLKITRQAVHKAIEKDRLDAYRVTRDGDLLAIYVTEESIDAYSESETRWKYMPKKLLARRG